MDLDNVAAAPGYGLTRYPGVFGTFTPQGTNQLLPWWVSCWANRQGTNPESVWKQQCRNMDGLTAIGLCEEHSLEITGMYVPA